MTQLLNLSARSCRMVPARTGACARPQPGPRAGGAGAFKTEYRNSSPTRVPVTAPRQIRAFDHAWEPCGCRDEALRPVHRTSCAAVRP